MKWEGEERRGGGVGKCDGGKMESGGENIYDEERDEVDRKVEDDDDSLSFSLFLSLSIYLSVFPSFKKKYREKKDM